jgi:hypothetical protein
MVVIVFARAAVDLLTGCKYPVPFTIVFLNFDVIYMSVINQLWLPTYNHNTTSASPATATATASIGST